MKLQLKHIAAATALVFAGGAAIAGTITAEEAAKIEPGMSMEQVKSLAGEGREVKLLGNDGPTFQYTQYPDVLDNGKFKVFVTYHSDGTVKSVQSVEIPSE